MTLRRAKSAICKLAFVGLLPASLIVLAPTPSYADGDRAGAQVLFEDGLTAFDAGRYEEACKKFEASNRADASTGTMLNLGRCYEKIGKTASAWTAYDTAASSARREGDRDRANVASQRATALFPLLPRLTIDASASGPARISRDGVDVDPRTFGTGLPVDPGAHVVTATADGYESFHQDVTVAAGARLTVTIPALKKIAQTQIVNQPEKPADRAQEAHSWTTTRKIGIGVGVGGIVALGVGTFFGISANSKLSDSQPHCPNNVCDQTGVDLNHDAKSAATFSTVFFVVGGACVAGGVALFVIGARDSSPAKVTGFLSPTGLGLRGAF